MTDMNNTIAIGSDHAGFNYKSAVIDHLQQKGFEVKDQGTFTDASCDYPDYAHAVAGAVENDNTTMGILICGSANGVAITANKHQGVRAAICWEKEIASLARQHNDANIICIPARFVNIDLALEMVDIFLSTEFEGGRHLNRVQKIKI
ncbi:MAG: ribose 5-phosphate isomerase B [Chitinophagaceae bacterium]|nr:ribose 5-phosphate isomerase B [Chitinophagaceae bacterium]MCE2757784.1 ribose 5-phosphate isomerase B [Chitinophagaceae bacterium]